MAKKENSANITSGRCGPIPYSRTARSGEDYAARKRLWLIQVAKDGHLPPSAYRVSQLLPKWINRKTEEAFPAQQTIAEELGLTTRAVTKALAALVQGGHLSVKRGKRGYKGTNTYKMELRGDTLVNERSSSHRNRTDMTNERSLRSGTSVPKEGERLFGQTIEETNKRTSAVVDDIQEPCGPERQEEGAEKRVSKEAVERILREAYGPKCLNKYGGFQR